MTNFIEEGRVYSEQLETNLGISLLDLEEYFEQSDSDYLIKYDRERKDSYLLRVDVFTVLKWKHGKLNNNIFKAVCAVVESVFFPMEED